MRTRSPSTQDPQPDQGAPAPPAPVRLPGLVSRHAGNLTDRDVHLWRAVAATVIAAEIALPPALLVEQTWLYAVVTGIGMHVAFTCLKPRQLITFSGITLATYVAFAV
ncbi:hypothetical protein [Streptomyces sp. NPDC048737]|uniref:hypothetical protein n=1 Tax=unclassified Streptomyces TaxID=2593676 RepID=UPI00341F3FE7